MGKDNPRHTYTMKDGSVINNLVVTECEKDLGVGTETESRTVTQIRSASVVKPGSLKLSFK